MGWFQDRIPLSEEQAIRLMNDLLSPNRQEAEAREKFLNHLMETDVSDDNIDYAALDLLIPPKSEKKNNNVFQFFCGTQKDYALTVESNEFENEDESEIDFAGLNRVLEGKSINVEKVQSNIQYKPASELSCWEDYNFEKLSDLQLGLKLDPSSNNPGNKAA